MQRMVDPDRIVYPCGCGGMVRAGEDRAGPLDYIPARCQGIVTVRPRYARPRRRAKLA
jgi:transposase